jgi:hypothetical protein
MKIVLISSGVDIDGDDDLALWRRDNLQVAGRPEPALGQLHRPRLGIGCRGARLLLLSDGGLVGLGAADAFGLERADPIERRRDRRRALARGTLLGRLRPIADSITPRKQRSSLVAPGLLLSRE